MSRLKTLRDLEPYWIEVNRLENEADRVYRKLLTKLFSGDYEALEMVKLREIADCWKKRPTTSNMWLTPSRRSQSRNPDAWHPPGWWLSS